MSENSYIPLMIPDIREEDIQEVVSVLRSGMLVQGERVENFEKQFAKFIGVSHAIAVSNGTASLHLALVALGIGKGDEVIVPAFSFLATANVVELVGATPIFVDIELNSFNIDVSLIEKSITDKTKAIIPVHEFGLACDITSVCELANKHGLKVIEDAACALGSTENEQYTGSFGNTGSFSFHPRKAITSGEGGMITTNDDDLARKLRILRNHGIEIQSGKMEFVDAGFNYRMTDFQAALLSSQFERFSEIIEVKNKLAEVYFNELHNCEKIQLPVFFKNKKHTWQSFHIILDTNISRDGIIEQLKEVGIGTNLGAQCMPAQPYYFNKYKLNYLELFPNSMKAYEHGLVLPLYNNLTSEQIINISFEIIDLIEKLNKDNL